MEEQSVNTSSIKYVSDKDDATDGITTKRQRRISHVKTSSLLLDNYNNNKELAVPRRLTFSAPLGEVIPPPFIYTKELHSTNQDMFRSLGNNDTKIYKQCRRYYGQDTMGKMYPSSHDFDSAEKDIERA